MLDTRGSGKQTGTIDMGTLLLLILLLLLLLLYNMTNCDDTYLPTFPPSPFSTWGKCVHLGEPGL